MNSACSNTLVVSKIKVEENGRQAIIKNPSKTAHKVTKVDGCLIMGKTAADWAISKNDDYIVIELKGCNVDHAVDQVIETIRHWRLNKLNNGKSGGLIVCTRHPKIDTKIQRAKNTLAKEFNTPLHIVTCNDEFEFEALLSFRGPYKI